MIMEKTITITEDVPRSLIELMNLNKYASGHMIQGRLPLPRCFHIGVFKLRQGASVTPNVCLSVGPSKKCYD